MSTLKERMNAMNPARRARIQARAAEIVAEEMTLKDLRKALRITQARLAKSLNITQDGVSRMEKRNDLLLSTLRKNIEAMGGCLRLFAEFPDRTPVIISGLHDLIPKTRRAARRPGSSAMLRRKPRMAKDLRRL